MREAFVKPVLSLPKYSWLKFVQKVNQLRLNRISKHSLRKTHFLCTLAQFVAKSLSQEIYSIAPA